jgi:hypothetical protein
MAIWGGVEAESSHRLTILTPVYQPRWIVENSTMRVFVSPVSHASAAEPKGI